MQKCTEAFEVFLHIRFLVLSDFSAEKSPGQRIALVGQDGVLGLAVGAEGNRIDAGVLGFAVLKNLGAAVPRVLFRQGFILLARGDDAVGQAFVCHLGWQLQ